MVEFGQCCLCCLFRWVMSSLGWGWCGLMEGPRDQLSPPNQLLTRIIGSSIQLIGLMYVVESILDSRFVPTKRKNASNAGKFEYLVKWQGWAIADATWEPVSNLKTVQAMLDEYNLAHRQQLINLELTSLASKQADENREGQEQKGILLNENEGEPKKWRHKKKQIMKAGKRVVGAKKSQEHSEEDCPVVDKKMDQDPVEEIPAGSHIPAVAPAVVDTPAPDAPEFAAKPAKESIFVSIESSPMRPSQQERKISPITLHPQAVPATKADAEKNPSCQSQGEQASISDRKKQNGVVIGMRRDEKGWFWFLIQEEGEQIWAEREYVIQRYARRLCEFYEQRVVFEAE